MNKDFQDQSGQENSDPTLQDMIIEQINISRQPVLIFSIARTGFLLAFTYMIVIQNYADAAAISLIFFMMEFPAYYARKSYKLSMKIASEYALQQLVEIEDRYQIKYMGKEKR